MTARGRNYLYGMAALFVFLFGAAHADETKTLSWSVPTARIDGTPLAAAELTKYDLGCAATAAATPIVFTSWSITDPTETSRAFGFPVGDHFCSLRVYVAEPTEPSDWSNQVFFSILKSRANPPADLSVN